MIRRALPLYAASAPVGNSQIGMSARAPGAPSRWTYLSRIDHEAWVMHDPAVGGVHLLDRDVAGAAERLLRGESESQEDIALVAPTQIPVKARGSSSTGRTLTVWLSLTDDCNMGCRHCYIHDLGKMRTVENARVMSARVAVSTLTDLARNASRHGYRRIAVRLAGGEPLLALAAMRALFEGRAGIAASTGVSISFWVLTNGSLLTEEVARLLKRHQCGVSISIDGDEAAHNAVRFVRAPQHGIEGSWAAVWTGIAHLQASGVRPFLLVTVTPRNLESLTGLATLACDRGVAFRLSLVRDAGSHSQQGIHEEVARAFQAVFDTVLNSQ